MATQIQPQDKAVTANGLNLHYIDWGTAGKPTMVLLHGLMSEAHCWDDVAPVLRQDYHVLALDQRGRGGSDWSPDGDYSIDAYVADLAAFANALDLGHFILVGHSMGGRNAMAFTARYANMVTKLVIVDIGPVIPDSYMERIAVLLDASPEEFDSFDDVVKWQAQQSLFATLSESDIRRRLTHSVKELPNGKVVWSNDPVIRDQRRQRGVTAQDIWSEMGNIVIPTLIMRGVDSIPFPREMAQQMVQVIPNGELGEIQRAAHMIYDENPDDFFKALRDFLGG